MNFFNEMLLKRVLSQFGQEYVLEYRMGECLLTAWLDLSKEFRADLKVGVVEKDGKYMLPAPIAIFVGNKFLADELPHIFFSKVEKPLRELLEPTVVKSDFYSVEEISALILKWVEQEAENLTTKLKKVILDMCSSYKTKKQFDKIFNIIKGNPEYWEQIAAVNTTEYKIFNQVQQMVLIDTRTYMIQAVHDDATCSICKLISGTEFAIENAVTLLQSKMGSNYEDLSSFYPRPSDLTLYTDLSKSPYALPGYHPYCRCTVIRTS
jgi:hypothetical protein